MLFYMFSYCILLIIIILLLHSRIKLYNKLKSLELKCPSFIHKGYPNPELIKLYGRDNCFYTIKMKQLIKKEKSSHLFDFIDVLTEPGKSSFSKTNARGVPFFSYKDKHASGFMPLPKLFKLLNFRV